MYRTKAFVFGRGRDTLWVSLVLGGLVFFVSLHATWIALALYFPYKGL